MALQMMAEGHPIDVDEGSGCAVVGEASLDAFEFAALSREGWIEWRADDSRWRLTEKALAVLHQETAAADDDNDFDPEVPF